MTFFFIIMLIICLVIRAEQLKCECGCRKFKHPKNGNPYRKICVNCFNQYDQYYEYDPKNTRWELMTAKNPNFE